MRWPGLLALVLAVTPAEAKDAPVDLTEATVAQLIDAVYGVTYEGATAAIKELGARGPAARAAVHPLQQLLGWNSIRDRLLHRTLESIGTAGMAEPRLKDADKPALVKALQAADQMVRGQAAYYLRPMRDPKTVPALGRALAAEGAYARMHILKTLRVLGPAGKRVFLRELASPDVERRRIGALGLSRPLPDMLPVLRTALRDEDYLVRLFAVRAIGGLGRKGAAAVPDLVAVLQREPRLIHEVLLAMSFTRAPEAVPVLVGYLKSKDVSLRRRATECFRYFYGQIDAFPPALAMACFDDYPSMRYNAMQAIGTMKAKAALAAPYLAELADASVYDRGMAEQTLRLIGAGVPLPPRAKDAAPLRKALEDIEREEAGRAAFQLGRLQASDEASLLALRRAMDSSRGYVHVHAALALERIGEPGVPHLLDALQHGSPPARRLAIQALARMAPLMKAPPVAPLVAVLSDDDAVVRQFAVVAVGSLGRKETLARLVEMVRTDEPIVANAAISAIGNFGSSAAAAVPVLLTALADDGDRHSGLIVLALGKIGPAAEPAVPAIVATVSDGRGLGHYAFPALIKIGPAGQAAVVEVVRNGAGMAQSMAIHALLQHNVRPPGLRAALESVLTSGNAHASNAAQHALSRVPPEGPFNVKVVIQAMTMEPMNGYIRSRLPYTIATGARPDQVIPFLSHADERICWCAWSALSRMDTKKLTKHQRTVLAPLIMKTLAQKKGAARFVAGSLIPVAPPKRIHVDLLRVAGLSRDVMSVLGKIPGALDVAIANLGHKDRGVRFGALKLFDAMRPLGKDAVAALEAALERDKEHRSIYLRALVTVGKPAMSVILRELPRSTPVDRRMLFDSIASFGDVALPGMEKAFQAGDEIVRREVVYRLLRYRKRALPLLLRAAVDESRGVRQAAFHLFGQLPDHAKLTVPLLIKNLPDRAASAALRALGETAVEGLAKAARDPDPKVRKAALAALAADGKLGVDTVKHALADPSADVRLAAAEAAGRSKDKRLIPGLRKALEDTDARVRKAAAHAVSMQGDAAVFLLPDLVKLFGKTSSDRIAATRAMERIGAAATPYLVKFLERGNAPQAKDAMRALARIGEPGMVAVLFGAGKARSRERAGETLVLMRAKGVPPLIRLLKHEKPDVRRNAAWRLGQLKKEAAPAVAALGAALSDKETFVVSQAAWSLGEIGPAAAPAISALKKLLGTGVAAVARASLRKIRGS